MTATSLVSSRAPTRSRGSPRRGLGQRGGHASSCPLAGSATLELIGSAAQVSPRRLVVAVRWQSATSRPHQCLQGDARKSRVVVQSKSSRSRPYSRSSVTDPPSREPS